MKRWLRVVATLVVTALAVAYIVLKIDLGKTVDIIASASIPWLIASAFLTFVTVPPQAWRWQQLLAVRGVREGVPWLTRTYFVSYAWGQILPTSVGGDASRIIETVRRHPGQGTPITGSVLLERALGGAVTLLLAGVGFLLALGRYPIGAYVWPEAIFVAGRSPSTTRASRTSTASRQLDATHGTSMQTTSTSCASPSPTATRYSGR